MIGELTGAPGDLDIPTGIAVAPDGTIWVAEGGADRFAIFNADGSFVERWGNSGSDPGQFDFTRTNWNPLSDIAFTPEGDFYVADPGNARIQHFGRDRKLINTFGSFGRGDGQFLVLFTIALDADGNVYASDDSRSDVQVFSRDGRYLRTIGGPGHGDGQFFPGSIGEPNAVGDRVIVADGGNRRIAVFRRDGSFIENWTRDDLRDVGWITGLADGNLLVGAADWLSVLAPDGSTISRWEPGDGAFRIQGTELPDGRILLSHWAGNPPTDHERVTIYRLP